MTGLVYAVGCLLLCCSAVLLNVVPRARQELRRLAASLAQLRGKALTDGEKERRARHAAVEAFTGTGQLFLRLAVAVGATLLPVWLADASGLVSAGAVGRFALRLDVIIATTVIMILVAVAVRLRDRAEP